MLQWSVWTNQWLQLFRLHATRCQKRQLPQGWLVNSDGASARRSPVSPDMFYCGRRVLTDDPRTDGYCGPTDGAHCSACQRLNEQQQRRYGNVWRN